jgi:hypothetical protein
VHHDEAMQLDKYVGPPLWYWVARRTSGPQDEDAERHVTPWSWLEERGGQNPGKTRIDRSVECYVRHEDV